MSVNARLSLHSGSRAVAVRPSLSLQRCFATSRRVGRQLEEPQSKHHQSGLSPRPSPRKAYSPFTVSVVSTIGRLLGYNTVSSTAIRTTSDMYDKCAERADEQAEFWYTECGLPRSYQSWFQITNLHIHLLLTRFRALPADKAQKYGQELINHYFIDAESRMRLRFGVQTSRLVTNYMREMHAQQRGALVGLDEALTYSIAKNEHDPKRVRDADAALATALWRNLWGTGGWGEGVGGVKRKLRGIDRLSEEEKAARRKAGQKETVEGEEEEGMPELALDIGMTATGRGEQSLKEARLQAGKRAIVNEGGRETSSEPTDALLFAVSLQRLVRWYRRETVRLAQISNDDIEQGRVGGAEAVRKGKSMAESLQLLQKTKSIAQFTDV